MFIRSNYKVTFKLPENLENKSNLGPDPSSLQKSESQDSFLQLLNITVKALTERVLQETRNESVSPWEKFCLQ